jgi:hypothetical protein
MERRFPTWVPDGIIAVALFVVSLSDLRQIKALGIAEQFSPSPDALGILLIALQCLPLAVRRLLPVTVTIVILGSFIVDRGLDYPSTARLDVLRAISYE